MYYSKAMVLEDSSFRKSKEGFEKKKYRKIGPKKMCKNKAKMSQNGAQMAIGIILKDTRKKHAEIDARKKNERKGHRGPKTSNPAPKVVFGAGGGEI